MATAELVRVENVQNGDKPGPGRTRKTYYQPQEHVWETIAIQLNQKRSSIVRKKLPKPLASLVAWNGSTESTRTSSNSAPSSHKHIHRPTTGYLVFLKASAQTPQRKFVFHALFRHVRWHRCTEHTHTPPTLAHRLLWCIWLCYVFLRAEFSALEKPTPFDKNYPFTKKRT